MAEVVQLVGGICLIAGSVFAVIGGIGLLRLPDLFARMHGAGITDTLGAGLVLIGLVLHAGPGLAAVKLLMILFFLLVTSPTSTHALAQSALSHDVNPRLTADEDQP